ncbi:MAG: pantoate--beta-alanine ligase [Mariprofundaceae bacterium]
MNIVKTTSELKRTLAPVRGRERVAFVPTMGCLHEGHLSLIRKARRLADIVVVSIYVNPMQFGADEDLDAYPRTFEQDRELCEREGVNIIFHPDNLYPADGIKTSLKVDADDALGNCLCGAARPGHFDGVVTVVNMLFNIVQPDIALFGEKDYQQLTIINRMVNDLHVDVEVIGCETLRETDGLAMSSRNRYLSEDDRKRALFLQQSLQKIAENAKNGEKNCKNLIKDAKKWLKSKNIDPEYLEIRSATSLEPLDTLNEAPARIFIAATIGNARLIDNIALEHVTDNMINGATENITETLT